MTRLTIAVSGDNETFAPVSSALIRRTKSGPLNVVIMFFGTDYNISMAGVLQSTTKGNVINDTISVADSKVKLEAQSGNTEDATLIGGFTSFMYFYPKLKIRGHLEISESSDSTTPMPNLEGNYQFTDLVTGNVLKFNLRRKLANNVFELIKIIDGVSTVIADVELPAGVLEYDFEFRYLENGKSKLFNVTYSTKGLMTFKREWIGNLGFNPAECSVNVSLTNGSATTLKHMKSDSIFLKYPNIYLGYDPVDGESYFTGQIIVYDDINSVNEDDWVRVISRDYQFIGNRIIENGIIRIVITTNKPIIELYGWNYTKEIPGWEYTGKMIPLSDDLEESIKLQSVLIDHINVNQIRLKVNFGSTIYVIRMSRGSPFINIFSTASRNIKIVVPATRFIGDFMTENNYDLKSSFTKGNPIFRNAVEEEITNVDPNDNYWGWYTSTLASEVVGWLSNFIKPTKIKIKRVELGLEFLFTYDKSVNILGFGVLPGSPSNVVNDVPLPFAIGNIDDYVKWRANEAMVSFRQDNFLRRRS